MDKLAIQINQHLEENREEILKFLAEYVQKDSTNPALGENDAPYACHEWLTEKLNAYGIFDKVDFWKTGDGFSNVVAVSEGEGEPLMFAAHSDTVPVTDTMLAEWGKEAGPWSGLIKDGNIYGRGASDMKAGGAAPLMAMMILNRMGIKPKRPVYFTYVMSEENGGREKGVDSIVERGYMAKDCVVTEPSHDLEIYPYMQGEFYFTITVNGKSYHLASRHHTIYPHGYTVEDVPGINAIELAIEIIQELQYTEKQLGLYKPHAQTEWGSTTFNISGIQSKGIFSAGAEECRITGSMLYNPAITQDEAFGYFREAVARATQRNLWLQKHPPKIELPYMLSTKPPVNIGEDHPLCHQLAQACRAFDKEAVFESDLSTSDANYLQDHGIDTVNMGPGKNEYGVHGVNEYVPVDVYLDAVARFAYFLSLQ